MSKNIVYDLCKEAGCDEVYQLDPNNNDFGSLDTTIQDGTFRIENINSPQLAIYKVNSIKAAPVVIICPGGGYNTIALNKEGTVIAKYLQEQNIATAVLTYRTPKRRDDAYLDLVNTVNALKDNAVKWNIDVNQIGGIGFSAGGHLIARGATTGLLNFSLLIYPAYLNLEEDVAPELTTLDFKQLPPIFIAHSNDDTIHVKGSKIFSKKAIIYNPKSKFHCYETGGHGYGLYSKGKAIVWPQDAKKWLKEILFNQ